VSPVLPEDTYTTSIEFRDRDNAIVAVSLGQTVEVGGWNAPFEPTVYLDAGYVSASWSWGTNERWCSDGWNPFEVIRVTLVGPTSYTQLFSCDETAASACRCLPVRMQSRSDRASPLTRSPRSR
jgi:hypothetical protein